MKVSFLDLARTQRTLSQELASAFERVVSSGSFILGDEVASFEAEFAAYCGMAYCVGVGNGMDAITLVLRALDVGPGDEVVTVAFTAFPTAAAISAVGATPVFVDVLPDTQCMDPQALADAITSRTRAVVPVHIYGRCADMDRILSVASAAGLPVVEDAAQAHGARCGERAAGSMGRAAAFSFYPTKNLGALGDGGAVVTDDGDLADRVRQLRNYGERSKYVNVERGQNSRLDELQAAFLRVKLLHLDEWNSERRRIAARYDDLLRVAEVETPVPEEGHIYHLYVVRSTNRDALRVHLESRGIGSAVHYPTPVHQQPAYAVGGAAAPRLAVTESLAGQVLSLPAYPGLSDDELLIVAEAVTAFSGAE